MPRFIIIVERDKETVFPVVEPDDSRDRCCLILHSFHAAETVASNSPACIAFGYKIVDLDAIR